MLSVSRDTEGVSGVLVFVADGAESIYISLERKQRHFHDALTLYTKGRLPEMAGWRVHGELVREVFESKGECTHIKAIEQRIPGRETVPLDTIRYNKYYLGVVLEARNDHSS
jgi:hypothetical protein